MVGLTGTHEIAHSTAKTKERKEIELCAQHLVKTAGPSAPCLALRSG
jgi:hypothetical protein